MSNRTPGVPSAVHRKESMTVPNRTLSPDELLNAKELLQEIRARFTPHKVFDFASPVATPHDVWRRTGCHRKECR